MAPALTVCRRAAEWRRVVASKESSRVFQPSGRDGLLQGNPDRAFSESPTILSEVVAGTSVVWAFPVNLT